MLVPLVVPEVKESQESLLKTYQDSKQLTNLLVTCVAFTVWVFCSIYSSHHNDIGQIVALASCQYLFLGLYRVFSGTAVSEAERKGILATLASVGILLFWNSPSHTPNTYLNLGLLSYWEITLNGNLVAFLGSGASAVYLIYSPRLRTGHTLHFSNLNLTLFGLGTYLLVHCVFEGKIDQMSGADTSSGLLDIFTLKIFLEMTVISLFTGLVPNLIYPSLTRVFEPVVLGTAFVIQPVSALILAMVLELQTFPSLVVLAGILLSVFGNFLVRREVTHANSGLIAIDEDQISVDRGEPLVTRSGSNKGGSKAKPRDLDLLLA